MQFFISILFFPLSLWYGLITKIRNWLFDIGILKSVSHNIYVISIGNLRAGGTGKTPFVEYLLRNLPLDCNAAVISRGYGRRSKGYRKISNEDTALSVGDEPLQMYRKFKHVTFAVSENRNFAIRNLVAEDPKLNVIILDDAFQHRYVKADLSILLTAADKPFFKDFVLPFGMLREYKNGYKRADMIVVTKCPQMLFEDMEEQKQFTMKLKPLNQQVLFSRIKYNAPYLLSNSAKTLANLENQNVLFLSAIADSRSAETYLCSKTLSLDIISFNDHHHFTHADIEKIKQQLAKLNPQKTIIITTEKDAVRLPQDIEFLTGVEVYVLGIEFELNSKEHNFIYQK